MIEASIPEPHERTLLVNHVCGVEEGVVDGDDLDGSLLEGSTEDEATDAAKSNETKIRTGSELRKFTKLLHNEGKRQI